MRSEALAVIALAAAACGFTDVSRPIGVIGDELDATDADNLAEAARCWNLELGTQLVAGPGAAALDQQVVAFYDRATCMYSLAQMQDGWPSSIAICPEAYWRGLAGASAHAEVDPLRDRTPTPFRVLSHELGHALNIIGHPDDPLAVMAGGGFPLAEMFRDADRERFAGANPGFTPRRRCARVVRSIRPGTGGRVGRCACGTGRGVDPARPLAFVISPGFEDTKAAALATAAQCWNLRYGTAIAVRPGGTSGMADAGDAGDQVVRVDPLTPACGATHRVFVPDEAGGLLCASTRSDLVAAGRSYVASQMRDISQVFGFEWEGAEGEPFDRYDDAALLAAASGMAIRCRRLHLDLATGACSCQDAPPGP